MSTFSSDLKIELIGTGEQSGVWGTTTNSNFSNVFEQALVGRVTVPFTDADVTLTATDTVNSQSFRRLYLNCTGANTGTKNLIVPTINKTYVVQNNTTGGQSIVVKTSAGNGVTVPNGKTVAVYVDGTDVIQAFDYVPTLGVGTANVTTLNVTTIDTTNIEVTNIKAKDGTAAASIADSTGVISITANPVLSGGTANGVLYLNGSKSATSGSALTFDGTNFATTGTVSGTKLIPTGGTATGNGMYLPVANAVSITTNGADRVYIDSSGNVGIGTTSPSCIVDVVKSTDSGSTFPRINILNSLVTQGNGTTTFNYARIDTRSGNGTVVSDFGTRYDSYAGGFLGTETNHPIFFQTNGAERMRIDSIGRVGIGTSSPTNKFEVKSSGDTPIVGESTGASSYLLTKNSGGGSGIFSTGDVLGFFTSISGTERMRLDSSGNVGIGTSSPQQRLQINGSAAITGDSAFSGATFTGVTTRYISGNNSAYIQSVDISAGTVNGGKELSLDASQLLFRTISGVAFTERMRLDSSGNLGLGVTPSAWNTSGTYFKAIELGSVGSALAGLASGLQTSLSTNAYYSGGWTYAGTGAATQYYQTAGLHIWQTAPSGTAGNAITFTQAMTLDASGNLLVGTTSNPLATRAVISHSGAGYALTVGDIDTYTNRTGIYLRGGNENRIGWDNAGYLTFVAGTTERARITSGGYFKASNDGSYESSTGSYHEFTQTADVSGAVIRATNASYASNVLDVAASRDTSNNSYYFIGARVTGVAYRFRVADSGNVTNTNGTYGTISDAKLKQDIVDASSQWDDIKNLRFRKYRLKSEVELDPNVKPFLGLVAQEAELVSPGLIEEHRDTKQETKTREVEKTREVTPAVLDEEGNEVTPAVTETYTETEEYTETVDLGTTTKSIKTSILYMKAVKALQEAQLRIETLEAQNAAFEARLAALESK